MLQMFRNGDLDYEAENVQIDHNVENDETTSEENETEGSSDNFFSTSDLSNSSSQSITTQEDETLSNLLDNPSIQMYPQNSNQVDLNSVQNLANVFDDIYQTPRQSQRLAAKPAKDYKAMLNPRY